MPDALETELLQLNQRLLESIAAGDWTSYTQLCDPTLSAFEPEGKGHLIEGLPFHHYYFELGGIKGPHKTTMSSPHVRLLGQDAAVVSYVRLVQRLDSAGVPTVVASEETRVWQLIDGQWRHVHFHRSPLP